MKKILILILLVISFLPVRSAEIEEWKHIAPNNYVYSDGIVGLKDIYGYSFMMKSYNKGQYEPVNGRQVEYILGQYEINCLKHTYKIGMLDSYDVHGYFINGDYNKYAQFQPIVEGTAIDIMSGKLCKVK